jgi:hypothetical protein
MPFKLKTGSSKWPNMHFLQKRIMDFIYLVIFEFLLHKQTAIWEYVTKAASRLVGNSIIPSNKMC